MVYLACLHGTKHQWARLAWLCDLAEAVRRHPEVEWRQVVGLAEGQGTLRVLLLGLELARGLLQAPLPDEVVRRIAADPGVAAMAARIVRRLGFGDGPPLSSADKVAFSRLFLKWGLRPDRKFLDD